MRALSRGVQVRLVAFIVLSAVGITYIMASYLGLFDRLTGRGLTVTATLPGSGGLFEGSEVTYRGVKIGKVSAMDATEDGVRLTLALEEGTTLPLDSSLYVHNLSAVGEQYLDFQPPDDDPPYAEEGSVFHGDAASLPVDEGDLLVDLDDFVQSVHKKNLQTVVKELGLMFGDTGRELQRLLDEGSTFIDEAAAHTDETVALLRYAMTVLRTQGSQSENIRSFAADLDTLTTALASSDDDLRQVLHDTPPAARQVQGLLEDLGPTLPVLLSDAINVNQVVLTHIAGVEQLLVTFPRVISSGFTGSTPDGWGHVNLQFDYSVPPCTDGYKPPSEWREPTDLSDGPIYPAHCNSGDPYVMRGTRNVPSNRANASPPRVYSGSYDPGTGVLDGVVGAHGEPVTVRQPGDLSVLGGDSWKWLLVGPVSAP